ncbi:MAG TPA: hypothetical protein QF683_20130 [SAR324 cluster bacterium]|jgi:hypothetical protein|nr:hypothetical protein [Pseudomonadota bacterium]MBP46256.1 hypothetical protein [Deltaproteobacteria bacterium]MDP7332103.1 hypothetical protein [SAR324 cluster bacterium]MDP7498019.1 hypothetical protein [SAR324 cluster bacterium]HJO46956.1 hypothetical protein [SAR324 cluster bacterium]|tara:strand:+ start:825 stop:1013 length:189 start_codon:yes stop_codon:yes gene_type:complete
MNPDLLRNIRSIGIFLLSATIHPDIKRTLVAISKRTGMTVSQVTDEVLYTDLIEMQELDAPG